MKASAKKNFIGIFSCLIIGVMSGIVISYINPGKTSESRNIVSVEESKLTSILKSINKTYIDSIDSHYLEELTIANFIAQLDPHSSYSSAGEADPNMENSDPLDRGSVEIYLADFGEND